MRTKPEANILSRPVSSPRLLRLIALADALADALAERQMKLRRTEAGVRNQRRLRRFARAL